MDKNDILKICQSAGYTDDTLGATRKSLIIIALSIFRVGIFATLKTVKQLSLSNLQVTLHEPSEGLAGLARHHQMPGRSWRAGQPCGDGKPIGPDVPP